MPQEAQDYIISYTIQGVESGARLAGRGAFSLGKLLVKKAIEKGLQAAHNYVRNYQATHGGEVSLAKLNKTVQKKGGQVTSGQIEIRDKDVDKFIKFCKDKMVKVAITKVQGTKDTYTVYASSQNLGNFEAALYQYKTMLEKGEPLSDRVQRETKKVQKQRATEKARTRQSKKPNRTQQKNR